MENLRPHVLFVDDEKGILATLRRLFNDEEWEMFFANSAEQGLEILKKESMDLVVSDVRMPGMNGIDFLSEVKKNYPHIVRIFLSGYADHKAVTKAFAEGCAQQLMPKPWDDNELKQVVRGALRQAMKQKEKFKGLQQVINSITALPPMPRSYEKIKEYLTDPDGFSIDKVAKVIAQDVALTAEMIRWANSALFGQRQGVSSVQRALVVLGSDIVEGIILAQSVFKPSGSKPVPGFSRQEFHTHSMACGITAKKLMEIRGIRESEYVDRAFTAGLLHDIGKLLEEVSLPASFEEIVGLARDQKCSMQQAEQEKLGTTHEEIGSYLAEWWSMPSFIVNAIRWHHNPSLCNADNEIIESVHMANALVQRFALGHSGNHCPPAIDQACLANYTLTEEKLAILHQEVIAAIP
jgi:HD-like signal output (HDOD) protein